MYLTCIFFCTRKKNNTSSKQSNRINFTIADKAKFRFEINSILIACFSIWKSFFILSVNVVQCTEKYIGWTQMHNESNS